MPSWSAYKAKGQFIRVLALCDGKDGGYSWRELANIAADHWSRKVRLWRIPRLAVRRCRQRPIAMSLGVTGKAPMLTPPKLRELRHKDWVVDNGPITTANRMDAEARAT